MKQQQIEDIIKYLRDNIDPLEDSVYGLGYRTSVYLTDGLLLPCVVFRNSKNVVDLAIKRFKEKETGKSIFKSPSGYGYYESVRTFVAQGNCINAHDIGKVEKSKFAFPSSFQKQIQGETTMGWTGFAAKMKDGKYFGFGTSFRIEFFQMPDGYSAGDIEEIINHSYVLNTGELRSHRESSLTRPEDYKNAVVYRERPFFECYIENL
jgi:hypothetical protein